MLKLVKSMLSRYYALEFAGSVAELDKREIALMYEEGKMLRHKHFNDISQLRQYLDRFPPIHLYYSTAYYSNPSAVTMEAKGWLGADVVFDIDSDKLDCDRYYKCISEGHYYASVIYDILKTEIGETPEVRFSGTRGFHIVSYKLKTLSRDGRTNLVQYIFSRYKHAVKYIHRVEVSPKIGSMRRAGAQLLSDKAIDVQVVLDVHRLIRFPDSVHGKSGLRCVKIELDKSYDPYSIIEKAMWARGVLKVNVVKREQHPKDKIFDIECGGVCTLPAQVALYALLRGFAEPLRKGV